MYRGMRDDEMLWMWMCTAESRHARSAPENGPVRRGIVSVMLQLFESFQASRRKRVSGRVKDEHVDKPDSTHRLFCVDN
jgi:hypothetical protein